MEGKRFEDWKTKRRGRMVVKTISDLFFRLHPGHIAHTNCARMVAYPFLHPSNLSPFQSAQLIRGDL